VRNEVGFSIGLKGKRPFAWISSEKERGRKKCRGEEERDKPGVLPSAGENIGAIPEKRASPIARRRQLTGITMPRKKRKRGRWWCISGREGKRGGWSREPEIARSINQRRGPCGKGGIVGRERERGGEGGVKEKKKKRNWPWIERITSESAAI